MKRPEFSLIGLFFAVAIFSSDLHGQALGGPYAGLHKWYVSYKILIKTKQKCCDIISNETYEGRPTRTIHYVIDHEYTGSFEVNGPIPGMGAPKLTVANGVDTRRNPALAAQMMMADINKYVGWSMAGSGIGSHDPIGVIIKDDIDSHAVDPGEGGYEQDIDTKNSFRFDDKVPSNLGHSELAFDLSLHRYSFDFSFAPITMTDDNVVKRITTETVVSKNDPNNEPDHNNTTTSLYPLKAFRNFDSRASEGDDLNSLIDNSVKFNGALTGNVQDKINVCQFENITKVHGILSTFTDAISQDIIKNKTVEVRIQFEISKLPIMSLGTGCK